MYISFFFFFTKMCERNLRQPFSCIGSIRLCLCPKAWMVVYFVFQAQKVSDDLLQKISSKNRRALDLVAAKCYYYHARVYEFLKQFDTIRRYRQMLTLFLSPNTIMHQSEYTSANYTYKTAGPMLFELFQFPAHSSPHSDSASRHWRPGGPPEPAAEKLPELQPLRPGREAGVQICVPRASKQQRVGPLPVLHRSAWVQCGSEVGLMTPILPWMCTCVCSQVVSKPSSWSTPRLAGLWLMLWGKPHNTPLWASSRRWVWVTSLLLCDTGTNLCLISCKCVCVCVYLSPSSGP